VSESDTGSGAAGFASAALPPPSEGLLAEIQGLMSQVRGPDVRDSQDEALAESALGLVARELEGLVHDIGIPETADDANALVAAVDEWISLASSICSRVYAPASPSPEKLLKWSRTAVDWLRQICSLLEGAVSAAARKLNTSGWTIAVGFPWGASLGLDFDAGLISRVDVEEVAKRAIEIEDLRRQLADTSRQLEESREAHAKTRTDLSQAELRLHARRLKPPGE
jgi:hypothetical protein